MNKDPKTIAIGVLAVVLIIMSSLWIQEKNKPNAVDDFSVKMAENQAEVKIACANNTTDENRNKCIAALEETKNLLGDFYGSENEQ